MTMNSLLPISDARAKLTELVTKVNKNLQRITITVNGSPKAVLLSNEELESLEETLEILSNPKLIRAIKRGEKEIEEGKGIPWEDVQKELGLH